MSAVDSFSLIVYQITMSSLQRVHFLEYLCLLLNKYYWKAYLRKYSNLNYHIAIYDYERAEACRRALYHEVQTINMLWLKVIRGKTVYP